MYCSLSTRFQKQFRVAILFGVAMALVFAGTGCDLGTHDGRVQQRHGQLDPMKARSGARTN